MKNKTKNICVFSSSSNLIDEKYKQLAREFGKRLAIKGHVLVYGGGKVGLMGEMGNTIKQNGGKKIGIIPERLVTIEVAATDDDEQFVTATMHERKEKLVAVSDVFVAFPGGFGTLDELLEVITLKQLGYHRKPIYILNHDHFFDGVIQQFQKIYNEQFAASDRSCFKEVSNIDSLLNDI